MKNINYGLILICLLTFTLQVKGHDFTAQAKYLGNEAVLVTAIEGEKTRKVLFDPFFHNNYSTYTLVPNEIRRSIFEGNKPYDNIDAIFVSHAHGDHFSAQDVLTYLSKYPKTKLVAPKQAINQILKLGGGNKVKQQLISVELQYRETAKHYSVGNILIDAVRIPHAGWPGRANIENVVFRVKMDGNTTVMHLGDADPNRVHFDLHKNHWKSLKTDLAFVPYWFYFSDEGNDILENQINSEDSIGVHVPTKVPVQLIETKKGFLSKPGEIKEIK